MLWKQSSQTSHHMALNHQECTSLQAATKHAQGLFSAPGRAVESNSWTPSGVRGGAASSLAPGRCRDGAWCHAPVPVRMRLTASPPGLAAAWPRETTIIFQAVQGAFLAHADGCCEETHVPIDQRRRDGGSMAGGWVAWDGGGEATPPVLSNAWQDSEERVESDYVMLRREN